MKTSKQGQHTTFKTEFSYVLDNLKSSKPIIEFDIDIKVSDIERVFSIDIYTML